MKLKNIFAFLILSILFYSCEKDNSDSPEEKEISYNILQEGTFTVSEDNKIPEQYLVFKNEEEWTSFVRFMEIINPEKSEEFQELDFNFTDKTLLIVNTLHNNDCCKEIEIIKVSREQGRIYVDFETKNSNDTETNLNQSYLLLEVAKS